jgi:signal transduction histidine kinase
MLRAMSSSLLMILSFIAVTAGLVLLLWHGIRRMGRRIGERARNEERKRVAREIHDTLLQGIQVVLFRLDRWSRDAAIPPLQRQGIGLVAVQLRSIVVEARDKIAMLRECELQPCDLIERLKELGEAESSRDGVRFNIRCGGAYRVLASNTHEQLLMVASEGIRNAFKHAQARVVLVEVAYEVSGLSLVVVDDGRGIDDRVLEGGAVGHYGLPGMRERVAQIGGQMTLQSGKPTGTRLHVWIPAASAYSPNIVDHRNTNEPAALLDML